ncbi:MAG: hypothetical protein IJQ02_08585 [Oscillospiraceae bacterium]|nr:hypothetical protein [Oscillospiraceae bacterium]
MPAIDRYTEQAQSLISEYLKNVESAERSQSPTDGLLGTKGGVRDHPCHDRFVSDLEFFLNTVTADAPDSDRVRELLRALCAAPLAASVPKSAYWMLLAVQGMIIPLVDLLTPEDAAGFSEEYASLYPRRERLPAQQKLLDALHARCGKKKSRFPFPFFGS